MDKRNDSRRGSLLVAGAGLRAGQCTVEAISALRDADVVLSVMGDSLSQDWLEGLNANTRSLHHLYATASNRPAAYAAMVETIMSEVRAGAAVCAVFYGHPGVFVTPSHRAIAAARAEGYDALMLPGVSAEACLFADRGIDPGSYGCQSYEAHDFFVREPRFDTRAALILWQLAVLGDRHFRRLSPDAEAISALAARLMQSYPQDHPVLVYAAATLPVLAPDVQEMPLKDLSSARFTQESTLYVPPIV